MYSLDFLVYLKIYFSFLYILDILAERCTKNGLFWNRYKMGRTPIKIELYISSKDDDRFAKSRLFYSIPEATAATGFSERGIRSAYHSERTSIRKVLGEVYTLKWGNHLSPNIRKSVLNVPRLYPSKTKVVGSL